MGSTIRAAATHCWVGKAPWHSIERPHKEVQRPERKRDKNIQALQNEYSDWLDIINVFSFDGYVFHSR